MAKKIRLHGLCLCLIFFGSQYLQAQRYVSDQFAEVDKQTIPYTAIDSIVLLLDLYLPQGDSSKQRPLVLYVHGGGFSGGQRDGDNLIAFAEDFAKKGFAIASISYRLTMKGKSFSCDQPAHNKIKTFQAAVQDIRSATQFLIENQSRWGIDPDKIVLAGSSAGAEAVLHAAYWSEDYLPPGTASLPDNFRYAGVISMAGAIVDLQLINQKTAIPTLLFHGTCDNLVPYATAPHHYCRPGDVGYMILHGARSIADRLHDLGKPYYVFTSCGGKHEWAGRPLSANRHTILDFLYHDILRYSFRQIREVIQQDGKCDYHEKEFNYCK